jgi:NitT/TauT family transport system substrate-binding protein
VTFQGIIPLPIFLSAALAAGLAGCSRTAPAAASAPGPAAAAPLPKVRFKTDWFPQAEHGGFYQALAKGFYREAGIDVEIVPGGPGVPVGTSCSPGRWTWPWAAATT